MASTSPPILPITTSQELLLLQGELPRSRDGHRGILFGDSSLLPSLPPLSPRVLSLWCFSLTLGLFSCRL
ncbi:hypothetical protein Bca52824_009197 [Brassica carinata]|uniref:Uncharacterized protein n=1 Tax=Brassica carinata TaxID=52824 RepID=A0A8X8B6P2_BRACI|nr:hypothetical protein Bca52824_009197 [Brassica carinata]